MKPINYILRKMCIMVDADYKKIDFQEHNWFWKHTWTEEEQNTFTAWLADYLYTNKQARQEIMEYPRKDKKSCEKVASMFISQYGWKIA